MSLPSINAVLSEMGINDLGMASVDQKERALAEAMRRDLPLAVNYLHDQTHEMIRSGTTQYWSEDPKSPLGQQLIRVFAGTALRQVAKKYFCHGRELVFFNCCGGAIGDKEMDFDDILSRQIQSQNGEVAKPDC